MPSTIVTWKKSGIYPSDCGISQDHRNKTRFMLLYYSYCRPLREARGSHCHTSLEHQLPPHPLLFHHRELVSSVSRTPSHAAAAHAAARRCRTPPPHADAARRHPPSPPPPPLPSPQMQIVFESICLPSIISSHNVLQFALQMAPDLPAHLIQVRGGAEGMHRKCGIRSFRCG